ncbi:hypothetical protein XM25_00650 [Devosia sp. H5989]|nr:hypothetical protein XM25_00650 [Devosia sp. H5989]
MPYASEGRIAYDPIEGGIEISVEQYAAALEGVLEGKVVSIAGGALAVEFPPPEDPVVEPEKTLDELRSDKLAELDDYRWQREIGGVAFLGVVINTDGNSQQKIMAAYTLAKLDPSYSVSTWEVAPGVFMALDNATIVAMGDVVRQHIQSTFDVKAVLYPQISALENADAIAQFDIPAEWAAVPQS